MALSFRAFKSKQTLKERISGETFSLTKGLGWLLAASSAAGALFFIILLFREGDSNYFNGGLLGAYSIATMVKVCVVLLALSLMLVIIGELVEIRMAKERQLYIEYYMQLYHESPITGEVLGKKETPNAKTME